VRLIYALLAGVALLIACRRAEDPAHVSMRARLKEARRLTPDEIRAFFDQIAPVVGDKKVSVKQGAVTRELTAEERISVLGILSDPGRVYDEGLRRDGNNVWRGLTTGATPAMSELDAMQTLWIDVDSFIPRRYEFAYSSPGFGDYAFDLVLQ
jgi:hypothetical protein